MECGIGSWVFHLEKPVVYDLVGWTTTFFLDAKLLVRMFSKLEYALLVV